MLNGGLEKQTPIGLLATAKCQVKRLQLISKRDALLNAFVTTESTTQLMLTQLSMKVAEIK
jgi:hypothetical protein